MAVRSVCPVLGTHQAHRRRGLPPRAHWTAAGLRAQCTPAVRRGEAGALAPGWLSRGAEARKGTAVTHAQVLPCAGPGRGQGCPSQPTRSPQPPNHGRAGSLESRSLRSCPADVSTTHETHAFPSAHLLPEWACRWSPEQLTHRVHPLRLGLGGTRAAAAWGRCTPATLLVSCARCCGAQEGP